MGRRYARVAVGGTFDRFHRGHEAILGAAFDVGERVLIGITSDAMAGAKQECIEPLKDRMAAVRRFIASLGLVDRSEIIVLTDPAGPTATDPAIEALVVSPETEPMAHAINDERSRKGLEVMDIITIEFVLADDSVRISSTRIRKKEIDREGKVLLG